MGIWKNGPCLRLKSNNDEKDKFVPLKDIKIEDVSLEKACELLKYPYKIGKIENEDIIICKGSYGLYFKYKNKNYSLKEYEEDNINIDLILNITKNNIKKSNIIRKINKDIIIKSGKFGNYICYKEKLNVKIFSKKKIEDLTVEDCNIMIEKYKSFKKQKNKFTNLIHHDVLLV